MQVSSNKISDIRKYYQQQLADLYDEKEISSLLYLLFETYAGLTKAQILIEPETPITESQLLKINFAVKDLKNYKPIQYIIGKTEFYGLEFKVGPDVLIPRPETEELVELIIKDSKFVFPNTILDIGTGSGCIAISLKKHLQKAKVTGLDISAGALNVAKTNAIYNNVLIDFKLLDFTDFGQLKKMKSYDVIVSNPPYVRNSEKKLMKKNVLHYEPETALFVNDDDPLIFYKAIALFADRNLNRKGTIYCEINEYLAQSTAELFYHGGFSNVEVINDMNGKERFLKIKS
jgi:release factor glutamine methyltransferase